MTNFAQTVPHSFNGKHNMASDAFQALRDKQTKGEAANAISFTDLVDTINPLQHIPLVSTLYREITGDHISNQARIAGGALYGGPIGFVASMINSAIDLATGNDIEGHVMASLFDEKPAPSSAAPVNVAAATLPQPTDMPLITGSIMPAGSARPAAAEPSPPSPSPSPSAPSDVKQIASNATKPPLPMPQLSPEAFNALIGSFDDPEVAKKANAALASKVAKQASNITATAVPLPIDKSSDASDVSGASVDPAPAPATSQSPQDIAAKMASGLNQLEAMKTLQANSLSLNAVTGAPGTAGINSF